MLLSIALVLIAFLWLLWETNDLSVNLAGKPKSKTLLLSAAPIILALPAPKVQFDAIERPYSWKTAEQKENCLMLCQNNWNCTYRNKCRKVERWTGWKISARKLSVFGSTLNLNAQCNYARAFLLRDMAQAQKAKIKHTIVAPYKENITLAFGNGLFGDWMKQHENDVLPEQSIDISVGEKSINVNGNYEPKMIEKFMSQFTYKARAGRKVITVSKGDVVVDCGGGVYVTQAEN